MKLDLVVLAADKSIEHTIRAILARTGTLRIRCVSAEYVTHTERDPGCFRRAEDLLRVYTERAEHALVVFDREGTGSELSRADMEAEVEGRLQVSGWGDRARAIVIDPELEAWVWSDSVHVDTALGWAGHAPSLRAWLAQEGYLLPGQAKPERPKEAMEAAMEVVRQQRSAAVFETLASKVSLERCGDAAFAKLRSTLGEWFR